MSKKIYTAYKHKIPRKIPKNQNCKKERILPMFVTITKIIKKKRFSDFRFCAQFKKKDKTDNGLNPITNEVTFIVSLITPLNPFDSVRKRDDVPVPLARLIAQVNLTKRTKSVNHIFFL